MSLTSSFSFTNATAGQTVPTAALAPVTNYAKTSDEPTEATLTNKTCSLDQGEVVTYRCRDIREVSTVQQVLYPAKVLNGIEFGIRVDELLRTKTEDGNIVCDEPIVATLTIKTPKSSNINASIIDTVVSRLLGAAYDQTAKKYRWDDLMRSSLVPIEN